MIGRKKSLVGYYNYQTAKRIAAAEQRKGRDVIVVGEQTEYREIYYLYFKMTQQEKMDEALK